MKRLILFTFLAFPLMHFGQSNVRLGWLPEFSVTYSNLGRWSVFSKVESRQFFYDDSLDQSNSFSYQYDRTDLQFFTIYKLTPLWKIAIGYQYRFAKEMNSNRTIQQISTIQKISGWRFGHRLRLDQTFFGSEMPVFRTRYRFSAELALEGTELDIKEFYLKSTLEPLWIVQGNQQEIELRVGLFFGYLFTNLNKLEAGLDYRSDNYIQDIRSHFFLLRIAYYLSI
jgi:hypothetical protein